MRIPYRSWLVLMTGAAALCCSSRPSKTENEPTITGEAPKPEAKIQQLIEKLRTEPRDSWERAYGEAGRQLIAYGGAAVPYLVPLLGEEKEVGEKATEVLVEMGPNAAREIGFLLKREHPDRVTAGMFEVLARMAGYMSDADLRVAAYLASPSTEIRRNAARFLQYIRPHSKEVIEALRKAMDDPDPITKKYVGMALSAPGQ